MYAKMPRHDSGISFTRGLIEVFPPSYGRNNTVIQRIQCLLSMIHTSHYFLTLLIIRKPKLWINTSSVESQLLFLSFQASLRILLNLGRSTSVKKKILRDRQAYQVFFGTTNICNLGCFFWFDWIKIDCLVDCITIWF